MYYLDTTDVLPYSYPKGETGTQLPKVILPAVRNYPRLLKSMPALTGLPYSNLAKVYGVNIRTELKWRTGDRKIGKDTRLHVRRIYKFFLDHDLLALLPGRRLRLLQLTNFLALLGARNYSLASDTYLLYTNQRNSRIGAKLARKAGKKIDWDGTGEIGGKIGRDVAREVAGEMASEVAIEIIREIVG